MDRIDSVAYQLNSVAPEKSDLRFDVAGGNQRIAGQNKL